LRTIAKIETNDREVEVRSVEQVNKVAMLTVLIPHTSEYVLRLGGDYFAKVKTKTAI
jgi:hypothetical protein